MKKKTLKNINPSAHPNLSLRTYVNCKAIVSNLKLGNVMINENVLIRRILTFVSSSKVEAKESTIYVFHN